MRLRLFPRSLAGQLSVLLIAAVLIAQVVTLVFFAESRRSAIDAAAREQVLGRIATLANLIEETPVGQRDRILGALSTSRFTYSVTPEPLVKVVAFSFCQYLATCRVPSDSLPPT